MLCYSFRRAAVLITLYGLAVSAPAWAQDAPAPLPRYVHEAWTIEDGLPVNSVTDLIQDRQGYLWLSTFDGLVRFDGVRFTVFNTANTNGLPSNRITQVYEARDGALWLTTEQDHLVRFAQGRFVNFGVMARSDRRAHVLLHETADGALLVGTRAGLFRFDGAGFAEMRGGMQGQTVLALAEDLASGLWVGTDGGGLHRFSGGQWTHYGTAEGLLASAVTALYADPIEEGVVWVGTTDGIQVYRAGRLHPRLFDEATNRPRNFYRDTDGTLWFYDGRLVFHYRDGQMRPFSTEAQSEAQVIHDGVRPRRGGGLWIAEGQRIYHDNRPVLSVSSAIRRIVPDAEGSLWIATNAGGLHRLKPALFTVYGTREGLIVPNVYGLHEAPDGTLWMGTLGGGVCQLSDERIVCGDAGGGNPRLVWTVFVDRRGVRWVGSGGNDALCRVRGTVCEPMGDGRTQFGFVRALYEDRDGTLWIGARNGLFRYRDRVAAAFPDDPRARVIVRGFYEARDGTLWMATNGGGVLRHADGQLSALTTADGLSSDYVRALYEDHEGYLWIGTEDKGLNRLDLRDGSLTAFRRRDGLSDDVIHAILEDDHGRFWMSTNRGIFWVRRTDLMAFAEGHLDRLTTTAYDERDGMLNREANGGVQGAGLKTADGRLWFPTQNGLVVVDPHDIERQAILPPVVIEQVVAEGAVLLATSGPLTLAPDQRSFEIAYTGLSFVAPERMRFRFRLEGYETDWREVSRRTAYYTGVSPGDYTFRVRAANADGLWNEAEATLALTIRPYFYEARWFYGLLGLGLLLLGSGGYRYHSRQLRQRARVLEALVEERTETIAAQAERLKELDAAKSRFFANISHEFRTPLTLSIGPLEDMEAGLHGALTPAHRAPVGLALRNSRRLLRLVNQLLDVAKLEAGRLTLAPRSLDLVPFLGDLTLPFAPLAERQGIDFRLEAPPQPVEVSADPEQLEKVFVNLIGNAFKFTPAGGHIRVTLAAPTVGTVAVTVRDNGPGIPAERLPHLFERFYQADTGTPTRQPSTGLGLALVKELVELHGGGVTVESTVGFGSVFTVTLPAAPPGAAPPDAAHRPEAPPARLPGPTAAPTMAEWADEATDDPADKEADRTTVLVIDDNADIRAYVRTHLAPHYRVEEAADGQVGLARARTLLPDLIVSDVMMPEMDGYALCHALKSDPTLDFIPVILLTARASEESKIEGLEIGADDYLTKPFNARELVTRVENLIASRRRLKARYSQERERVRTLQATPEDAPPSMDEVFLAQVHAAIEARLDDPALSVERLAEVVGQSRSNLHRRLRSLLGRTPSEVIRTIRLEHAAHLLAARAGTVGEVAYAVGFNSVTYFSTRFREHYGCPPSAYAAEDRTDRPA